jgi:hypothetical protein
LLPISSIKGEVKKKHISFGWTFSCFAAHLIERRAGISGLCVYQARDSWLNELVEIIENFGQVGQKERGARQPHKRLLYCVNVNRTSLDHLLLGGNADVDKSVE